MLVSGHCFCFMSVACPQGRSLTKINAAGFLHRESKVSGQQEVSYPNISQRLEDLPTL